MKMDVYVDELLIFEVKKGWGLCIDLADDLPFMNPFQVYLAPVIPDFRFLANIISEEMECRYSFPGYGSWDSKACH